MKEGTHHSGVPAALAAQLEALGWRYAAHSGWHPPHDYWHDAQQCYVVPSGGRVAPGWQVMIGGQLRRQ